MGIIMCETIRDVQRSVCWVRRNSFAFRCRAGGHAWLPFSISTEIVIDVSAMNEIKIFHNEESHQCQEQMNILFGDKSIRSHYFVRIQPGVRLGVLADHLSPSHLSIPLGSCINVGIGFALGGGISPSLIRLSGILSDHLYSAKIVLATGQLKTLRGCHHPSYSSEDHDLLWSLKQAGGGNYGVIVEMTFNPCYFWGATVFQFTLRWRNFASFLDRWQKWAPYVDPRLSSELVFRSPKFHPEAAIEFKGQFEGSPRELCKILGAFLDSTEPTQSMVKHLQTLKECALFWGTTSQSYVTANSLFYLNYISKKSIQIYRTFLENAPGPLSVVTFDAMRGNVSKNHSSSFPWRKALFWGLQQGRTLDPNELPHQSLWVNTLYAEVAQDTKLPDSNVSPSYINVPQENLTRNHRYLPAYFGHNVSELIQNKRKWDPQNLFQFEQSIPLSVSESIAEIV
jgi:hypothetical protein